MFTLSKYADSKDYPPTGLQILRRGNFGDDVIEVKSSDGNTHLDYWTWVFHMIEAED